MVSLVSSVEYRLKEHAQSRVHLFNQNIPGIFSSPAKKAREKREEEGQK